MYLVLTVASLLSVFPLYYMFCASTNRSIDVIAGKLIPGTYLMENFKSLIAQQNLRLALWNSFRNATVLTVLCLLVCSIAGYGFEIYHEGKKILDYLSYGHLFDVRYITEEKCRDYFIKVTLSNESFALFFGGWLFGGDETPEMVVVVVSGDKAKVVFDDYAYAYKYTPGEHFSIEYVDDINGLRAIGSPGFTDSYLKKRTKYKIWREGNMLKYKSWK